MEQGVEFFAVGQGVERRAGVKCRRTLSSES